MKKINFKKVVISLCVLLTIFGCNLGFSSKAFAAETLMNYRETEVRNGFTTGAFEVDKPRAVGILNTIERWTTNDRSRQNMRVEVWKRIGVGQYEKVYCGFFDEGGNVETGGSFYHGGGGTLMRGAYLNKGIYKLKFISADKNAYVTVKGTVMFLS